MTNAAEIEYFVSTRMNELFMEWLDLPSSQKLIRRLISLTNGGMSHFRKCKSYIYVGGHNGRISSPTLSSVSSRGSPTSSMNTLDDEVLLAPLPFFTSLSSGQPPGSPQSSPRLLHSPTGSSSRSNIPIPRTPGDTSLVSSPPRSPVPLLGEGLSDDSFRLPKSTLLETPSLKPTAVPTLAVPAIVVTSSPKSEGGSIPAFYHPQKRPNHRVLDPEEEAVINKLFPTSVSVVTDSSELVEIVTTVLGLSRFFAEPLFKKINQGKGNKVVTRADLTDFWKGRLKIGDSLLNFFHVVKQEANDFITRADFREFLWVLLDAHPGLSFLRESPEFQERYADTVICRIFYHTDRRKVNKIYLRDLQRSTNPSIVKAWQELDNTDDINSVRLFFSYEHFYVLYCKFWDLDSDHDFLIDKEDLVKYDGHAWSPRAIDRVFAAGRKFSSGIPGKMGYEDFVWFILSDEDKSSQISLEFLFSLIDLDGDGVIRDHEMRFFYEEQQNRLECMNQDAPKFEDVLCQMNDLIKPEREGQFTVSDFIRKKMQNSGVFFSILVSLNKFMQYEQRDPFQIKQDQLSNPDFTDWDRFCLAEYVRLAMEAGSGNNSNNNSSALAEDVYLRNADRDIVGIKR